MSVRVRPAVPADAAALLALVASLAEYEQLEPPDQAAQSRLLSDAFGSDPRIFVLLAELDGAAEGYALFFETYSSFLARPTLYLEDLFVRPSARGHGLGRQLFQAVARQAVTRGCARMEWNVLRWNTTAMGFYERQGASGLTDWQMYRLDGPALARAGAA